MPEGGVEVLTSTVAPTGEAGALAADALALADRVRDGRLIDGYGRPFVYTREDARQARIYSLGRNGRDDGGAGDDVVAWVRLD